MSEQTSEVSQHDISLRKFQRRMKRINIAASRLDYLNPCSPFYLGLRDDTCERRMPFGFQSALVNPGSDAHCHSGWSKRDPRPRTKEEMRRRREEDDALIFNWLQSLLHRALDSKVGRRA
jgi:hypothetical protein